MFNSIIRTYISDSLILRQTHPGSLLVAVRYSGRSQGTDLLKNYSVLAPSRQLCMTEDRSANSGITRCGEAFEVFWRSLFAVLAFLNDSAVHILALRPCRLLTFEFS